MSTRRRIAVLTSGGDAPGMNAAIRAVVRSALHKGWEVFGVRRGFAGLIAGAIIPLTAREVGGILQLGGTFLGSARSPEFKTEDGQRTALRHLSQQGIDTLVVIGGNGSQTGSEALHRMGFNVVGIASTIDNDLYGSDITIGVDTALNIAVEAVDRLKTTASSHQRALLVEVMGRDCGYLALMAGLAGGAETIVIPEIAVEPEDVASAVRNAYDRGKAHALVVVAEGAKHNAESLVRYFREHNERLGFEVRATILGHVQRGGHPTVFDRLLATRLGAAAVDAVDGGQSGVLVGWHGAGTGTLPLSEVVTQKKKIDERLLELARVLSK